MNAAAATAPRFVRRTTLNADEYRVNFKQLDCDVLAALVSESACQATPLMSRIYLSLLLAPPSYWEQEGVLRFAGECREGPQGELEVLTAWEQMCELTGVSNSTLSKALVWLRETGIIGYYAGKNGVGIRIFFNRAAASIRRRPEASKDAQKNLRLVPAPLDAAPAPSGGAPFKENVSEKDLEVEDPRARAREATRTLLAEPGGALTAPAAPPLATEATVTPPSITTTTPVVTAAPPPPTAPVPSRQPASSLSLVASGVQAFPGTLSGTAFAREVAAVLQPELTASVKRESEALKTWFLNQAVPKATRVAQREAYDVLRAYGVLNKAGHKAENKSAYVGSNHAPSSPSEAPTSGAGQSPQAEVAAFLTATSASVQQFAAHCPAVTAKVRMVCEAVVSELGELRTQLLTGRLATPDALETPLQTLGSGLMEALWAALEDAEREALLQTARGELKQYAERMEPEMFRQTVRKRALLKLRERYRAPRLSLFYR